MGWLFTQGQTKSELVEHLTNGDSKIATHHQSVRGNRLWCVQENRDHPGRFIVVYLMQSDPGYGWGYKAVCESMGPAEVDCPLYMLDAAPVADSEYAGHWRERVRAHHKARADRDRIIRSLALGDRVVFTDGCRPAEVTVVSKKPLIGRCPNGNLYRVPRRMVAEVVRQ